jgi:Flp pilus assembly protein TadG
MRRLDERGVAAFEFCLVFIPFLMSVFVIFDLARYAITVQSLRWYANAGARQIMIGCYTERAIDPSKPACGTADLSGVEKPPFVSASAELSLTSGAAALTVTAADSAFTMGVTPLTQSLWPASFNNPSVSTQIPVPASSS